MKKYQIALIVGRFQPFHNGHLFLLKKALSVADKIIFGIGSASIYDKNNPLSYSERKKMIETVVKNEKISDRIIKIIPLEDFYNDEKWLENLRKKIGHFDITLGNNEWTNNILKKAGYKIIKVNHYKRHLYEGWRIRKLNPEFQIKNLKFSHIILGGTFDHFHKGHKALIDRAFQLGKNVTIGIATEKLYRNKFLSETIESFEIRKESVENYLQDGRIGDVISFSDYSGGADKVKKYEAIVVSKSTYPNALKINQLREKNRLLLLRIIIVDDILAEDGKLISSERIRAGEIDRNGHVYRDFFKKTLVLSETLKEELRKPIGKIYKSVGAIRESPKKHTMTIAVGDIIVNSLLEKQIDPDIKIIDYKSRRKPIDNRFCREFIPAGVRLPIGRLHAVGNPFFAPPIINNSGTIDKKAVEKINLAIRKVLEKKKSQTIVINGEEDLLALPSILLAPLNSLVLYGHWQYGIIAINVTEGIKTRILNLLKKNS